LKAWKETTTTSLSGVNLGYNKHWLQDTNTYMYKTMRTSHH
jgi:hypothetical protein